MSTHPGGEMRNAFLLTMVSACLAGPCPAQAPSELSKKFDEAQRHIVRLRPAEFEQLPSKLIEELERRKCTIPQEAGTAQRHNVIQGEFERPGQKDWAVLCSINGSSSILIFWNGSEQNPAEIARAEDRNFLQDMGGDKIGFSRKITVVNKTLIRKHDLSGSGLKLSSVDHQGIDDAFVEKASTIHYLQNQKWYQLTGSD